MHYIVGDPLTELFQLLTMIGFFHPMAKEANDWAKNKVFGKEAFDDIEKRSIQSACMDLLDEDQMGELLLSLREAYELNDLTTTMPRFIQQGSLATGTCQTHHSMNVIFVLLASLRAHLTLIRM